MGIRLAAVVTAAGKVYTLFCLVLPREKESSECIPLAHLNIDTKC